MAPLVGALFFLVPTLLRGNAYNKPRRVNPLRIGRPVVDSRLRGNDGEFFGNDGETFAGMTGSFAEMTGRSSRE